MSVRVRHLKTDLAAYHEHVTKLAGREMRILFRLPLISSLQSRQKGLK